MVATAPIGHRGWGTGNGIPRTIFCCAGCTRSVLRFWSLGAGSRVLCTPCKRTAGRARLYRRDVLFQRGSRWFTWTGKCETARANARTQPRRPSITIRAPNRRPMTCLSWQTIPRPLRYLTNESLRRLAQRCQSDLSKFGLTPSASAFLTRSATDRAAIFFIACPR